MVLSAGSRLGPYEILAPLGAGGMGEVYRARDPRLQREVAIKVLPEEFSSDGERLKRFDREARAASSLNHPNIVTVHEIDETDGRYFLVMERIQGRTLREMLATGPVPARQTLQIAAQVADGLAKAHESGIVHRDIKPENVMVTREGLVKILDFGLSKLTPPQAQEVLPTEIPTISAGTEPGVVMGTVAYMSPEQASGLAVDFRSDQFSLGSMLFEMVTGRRAFARQTKPETLAAIIRDEPAPIGSLSPQTAAPLRWIVERCLNKNPEERYVSTRDLARELATLRDHFSDAAEPATPSGKHPPWRRPGIRSLILRLGVVAVVFLAAFIVGQRAGKNPPPSFHRLTFRRGYVWSARFAPDGKTIVYGAAWDGKPVQLFSTRPENPESLSLSLPSADILSISSQGEMAISLGRHFVEDWLTYGRLARVGLSGTAPREVLERVLAADWAPDGDGLAIVRDIGGRTRLEFPVGKMLYETTGWITHPRISPDGKLLAFMDHPARWGDSGDVAVVDLSGKKTILSAGWGSNQGLAWSPNGKEVWFTASKLGFSRDLYAATPSGRIRVVARLGDNLTLHDVSREGRVLLSRDRVRSGMMGRFAGDMKERDLSWLDLSILTDLSSDGERMLFYEMAAGKAPAACVRKTDGSPPVRLGDGFPTALSSDGRWVLCLTDRLTLLPTGTGEARILEQGKIRNYWWAGFLPSDRILLAGSEEGHGIRLYVQDRNGDPRAVSGEGIDVETVEIVVSHAGNLVAAIGPDRQVFLYPIGGGAPRVTRGTREGDVPVQWSPDDASLFVFEREKLPAPVFKIDLATGNRQLWNELMPSDQAGVNVLLSARLTPDGKSYAYSYGQVLSELSLVDGLK